MVLFYILIAFNKIALFFINIIPTFETPAWILDNLSSIFDTIFNFNKYLPVSEAFTVVVFLSGFHFSYKFIKILLNIFRIDLNA